MFYTPKNMVQSILSQKASKILSENVYQVKKNFADSTLDLISLDKYLIFNERAAESDSSTRQSPTWTRSVCRSAVFRQ